VKEHQRTVEQQKDYIFDIFSKCREETASDRLQVYYPTLCEQVYLWYRDYCFIDVDKRGVEIADVIDHFIKDETILEVPNDKDGFFNYLYSSIYNKKKESSHEYNENDTIKIPKEKKRKKREVEDFIRMKESQLGRKLTANECKQAVSKWFKKQEYVDLLNKINVGSIYTKNNEGDEIDVLDYIDTHSDDPLEEYIIKTNKETIREAVKFLLEKKQKRSRDCYRSLYTAYCIKKYKDIDFLLPVLDHEIIDIWQKSGKKPTQSEIYLKYHPEAKEDSAEKCPSNMLSDFKKDLENYLKEKNPEIFS
jgi:hypothetical protein